ncbi:hypothetical protein NE562_07590 [Butyricicoccus faecihominis]|uniref:hypothetical protein n=1 Tax=Butyricicoccus faecihominis TaxID=1712515 RepID=UPI002479DEA5|nr:hypothetical protein [Butyricicoccus faecihominis]MCQ5129520.1 hypothetical protein [Butyricicoccus faecihominis]
MIQQQMKEERFACITEKDKGFIIAFTQAMEELGYTYDDTIGNGFCWGKYMLIFRKANVKSKNVVARIYIKEDAVVLRMFFNNVTKHASFISAAPAYIKTVFTGDYGNCKHCKGDHCKFRKDYVIDGLNIEKCNGTTFEFEQPAVEKLPDYLRLFREFYPAK